MNLIVILALGLFWGNTAYSMESTDLFSPDYTSDNNNNNQPPIPRLLDSSKVEMDFNNLSQFALDKVLKTAKYVSILSITNWHPFKDLDKVSAFSLNWSLLTKLPNLYKLEIYSAFYTILRKPLGGKQLPSDSKDLHYKAVVKYDSERFLSIDQEWDAKEIKSQLLKFLNIFPQSITEVSLYNLPITEINLPATSPILTMGVYYDKGKEPLYPKSGVNFDFSLLPHSITVEANYLGNVKWPIMPGYVKIG